MPIIVIDNDNCMITQMLMFEISDN